MERAPPKKLSDLHFRYRRVLGCTRLVFGTRGPPGNYKIESKQQVRIDFLSSESAFTRFLYANMCANDQFFRPKGVPLCEALA